MRRFGLPLVTALGLFLGMISPVAGQTVVSDPGTPYDVDGIADYVTTGSLMGGMGVSAFFQGALSPVNLSWGDLGGGLWGVTHGATGFSLTLGADTDTWPSSSDWTLTTGTPLTRLLFDGVPGKTLFDRDDPSFGTDGSFRGRDFAWSSFGGADPFGTTATYRNQVGVGGAAPVGDLYTQVDLTFQDPFVDDATFVMDTDGIAVPEPGTAALMVVGLFGLVGVRKRRDGIAA